MSAVGLKNGRKEISCRIRNDKTKDRHREKDTNDNITQNEQQKTSRKTHQQTTKTNHTNGEGMERQKNSSGVAE